MQGQPSNQSIQFTFTRTAGKVEAVVTTSALVDHFLNKVKLSQSYHTWVSYAHDLKQFFLVVQKPLEDINRKDCVAFMQQQSQAGRRSTTINRRLAAISSLFNELNLLDPDHFPANPVNPLWRDQERRKQRQSLYRKQPDRVPEIVSQDDLQHFFDALPTWRDRTLMLLLWISCLRLGEAIAIRFQDIECSHRSIQIPHGKGGLARTVFMDRYTFASLNKYLDEERRDLFPDVDEIFVAFKGVARGRPLTENAFQHTIEYHAEKCGLSYLHAHLFRHTGIAQLLREGMSEPAIRKLVGHRHADSLAPYLHLDDPFVESEFQKVEPAFSPTNWLHQQLGGLS
jgi:site-specific recombinase XerD